MVWKQNDSHSTFSLFVDIKSNMAPTVISNETLPNSWETLLQGRLLHLSMGRCLRAEMLMNSNE